MPVKDLNVTRNLTCSGTSKLGMWDAPSEGPYPDDRNASQMAS